MDQAPPGAAECAVSGPNRADQPDYIARLVGKVVTVSLETARLIAALLPLAEA